MGGLSGAFNGFTPVVFIFEFDFYNCTVYNCVCADGFSLFLFRDGAHRLVSLAKLGVLSLLVLRLRPPSEDFCCVSLINEEHLHLIDSQG